MTDTGIQKARLPGFYWVRLIGADRGPQIMELHHDSSERGNWWGDTSYDCWAEKACEVVSERLEPPYVTNTESILHSIFARYLIDRKAYVVQNGDMIGLRLGDKEYLFEYDEMLLLLNSIDKARNHQAAIWSEGLDSGTHTIDRDMKVVRLNKYRKVVKL